jgi:hypothetical protein
MIDGRPLPELWAEIPGLEADVAQGLAPLGRTAGISFEELSDRVARLHGKPILIEPRADAMYGALKGLWVQEPDQSRILISSTDSRLYQVHCILHEYGHIIRDHPTCGAFPTSLLALGTPQKVRARQARPDWSTAVPGESAADVRIESEAEYIAYRLAADLFRPRGYDDELLWV